MKNELKHKGSASVNSQQRTKKHCFQVAQLEYLWKLYTQEKNPADGGGKECEEAKW